MKRSYGLRMGVAWAIILLMGVCSAEQTGSTLTARRMAVNGEQNGRSTYRDGQNVGVGRLAIQGGTHQDGVLGLRDLEVNVEPCGLMVRTTVKHVFYNETDATLEGVFTFNLPAGSVVDRFAMTIQSETDLMEGTLLAREQAKAIYRDIVYGYRRDPGVLEMLDARTFRATIFPIPPKRTKTIVLSFVTPLEENVASDGTAEWLYRYPLIGSSGHPNALPPAANVQLRMKIPYVPPTKDIRVSLNMQLQSDGPNGLLLGTALKGEAVNDDWMVAWPQRPQENVALAGCVVQANRPDESSAGAFLLRAGVPLESVTESSEASHDVLILWDTSASRTESELAAGRTAILSLLGALKEKDRFTILAFDSEVRSSSTGLSNPTVGALEQARKFLAQQRPLGATDIGGAFAALRVLLTEKMLSTPCFVYIGDHRATQGRGGDELKAEVEKILRDMHADLYTVWPGPGVEKTVGAFNGLEGLVGETPICLQEVLRTDDIGSVLRQAFDNPLSSARISLRFSDGLNVLPRNERWIRGQGGRMVEVSGHYTADGPVQVNLLSRHHGEEREYNWQVILPKRETGNACVAKLLAHREAIALSVRGDATGARTLSLAQRVLCPETAFLVLESEEMYREFRIQRDARDGQPVRDVRSELLAGVPTLPGGINYAGSPEWLGQVMPAAQGRDATRVSELQIDGTYIQVALNRVTVPVQQGVRNARLSSSEAMLRRIRLSQQIAERRGLPFEPETLLPQVWVNSLSNALQHPERLAEGFAPNADKTLWDLWAARPKPAPSDANTTDRQRNDADGELPAWTEMLRARTPSRFKLTADGLSLELDTHQFAQHLFVTVLYGLNPKWVKSSESAEIRRAIKTPMRKTYDLRNVPAERLAAAWNLLAELALIEGDPRGSIEAANRAATGSPGEHTGLTCLLKALACVEQSDCARAATFWQDLLEQPLPAVEGLQETLAQAYYGSAILCGESTKMTEAVERFGRVRMPQSVRLYQDLARMFLMQNRPDEALRAAHSIQEFRSDLAGREMTLEELLAVQSE